MIKTTLNSKLSFAILCVFCLFALHIGAQTFDRVEVVSGFGGLENNNGVAVVDYDRDLDLDIFVVALKQDTDGESGSESKLLRNNNDGTFTDVTLEAGLTGLFPLDTTEPFNGLEGFKKLNSPF